VFCSKRGRSGAGIPTIYAAGATILRILSAAALCIAKGAGITISAATTLRSSTGALHALIKQLSKLSVKIFVVCCIFKSPNFILSFQMIVCKKTKIHRIRMYLCS
jgi:hypothetical protein